MNPCKAAKSDGSLIGLARAQNTNVGCIGKWEKQMRKVRDNVKAQKDLYNAN